MPLRRTAAPATEPVTLAEAKLHLRVDHSADDALIGVLIAAAREQAEHRTGRSLIDQQWTLTLDAFPDAIRLRMGRVTAISEVRYVDPAGATQVLAPASYTLDNAADYANWLFPAAGYTWPATIDQPNAVTVVYRAGEASAANVPVSVKQWILLLVGQWYAHREAGAEKAITEQPRAFTDGLLDALRVVEV